MLQGLDPTNLQAACHSGRWVRGCVFANPSLIWIIFQKTAFVAPLSMFFAHLEQVEFWDIVRTDPERKRKIISCLQRHHVIPRWLVLLAYLADIFDKLNSLNVSLQGAESTIFDLHNKISAFKRERDLWKTKIETV
ncbi:unnamed protein product [Caretta caretta]